jgi:hypothetical protein
MSLKRKVSDESSIEDELYLLEEEELNLLYGGVSLNNPRIIQIHKKQLDLCYLLYNSEGVSQKDTTLYQLRLHARNYIHERNIRINYLNQIVHYHKPKQSTFSFNINTTTQTQTSELTREQLRELRLRRFNQSTFGKKMVNFYTKYKHKTRHEALIKLRKFFTKTIKNNE